MKENRSFKGKKEWKLGIAVIVNKCLKQTELLDLLRTCALTFELPSDKCTMSQWPMFIIISFDLIRFDGCSNVCFDVQWLQLVGMDPPRAK